MRATFQLCLSNFTESPPRGPTAAYTAPNPHVPGSHVANTGPECGCTSWGHYTLNLKPRIEPLKTFGFSQGPSPTHDDHCRLAPTSCILCRPWAATTRLLMQLAPNKNVSMKTTTFILWFEACEESPSGLSKPTPYTPLRGNTAARTALRRSFWACHS